MLTNNTRQVKTILWIRSILIDRFLDKSSEIEMLKYLTLYDYDVYLLAGQSEKRLKIVSYLEKYHQIHFILIPLRYVSNLTPILIGIIVLFYIPFFISIKRPKFIITEPGFTIIIFILKPFFYLLNCKIVLDIRSTPLWYEARKSGFSGRLKTRLFNISVILAKLLFDGITIITTLMKKEICEMFMIEPNFIGVWTMGVSMELFDPEKFSGTEIKNKLNLTNNFVIFYHGVFSYYRGLIESIKSIEILRKKHDDIVLFLLGKGNVLPILKELIRNDGLQDKVIIHDAIDYVDVPKYIAMCDVGIVPLPNLPDWRHQCPQKLLEYLSMEKVVIITDIPANREVIRNNKCGIYISSTDPNEIAKAIIYAYNNKKKLKNWGSLGRQIIEDKYSWQKVVKNFVTYLCKL